MVQFFSFNSLPLSELYGADHVYLTLPVGLSMRVSHLLGFSFLLKILLGGRGECNPARHRPLLPRFLHSCLTAALDLLGECQSPFFFFFLPVEFQGRVCTGPLKKCRVRRFCDRMCSFCFLLCSKDPHPTPQGSAEQRQKALTTELLDPKCEL